MPDYIPDSKIKSVSLVGFAADFTCVNAAVAMQLQTYIIHLERARSREGQVKRLLNAMPGAVQVVNAVDGTATNTRRHTNYHRHLLTPAYPFELLPAEIAAFLSHQACWRKLLDSGCEAALIFEDDVEINHSEFASALELVLKQMKQGDIIRLPVKQRERPGHIVAEHQNKVLFEPNTVGLGMQAQLLTASAAKKLLEASSIFDRPVDVFLQLRWHHGVRVLSVSRSGVTEVSDKLGGSLIQIHGNKMMLPYREVMRAIYRARVACRSQFEATK